ITFLISLSTYIYYNHARVKDLIFYIVLGLISLYVMIVVLQGLILKKNYFKLTLDESICYLFFLSLIGLGFASLKIFDIQLSRLVLSFVLFVLVASKSSTLVNTIVLVMSFGIGLYDFNLQIVAEFMILTLISNVFAYPQKSKIVFSVILGEIFVQVCFFASGWTLVFNAIPVVIAGLVFLFIPNKILNGLSDVVYVKKSELSSRNLINMTRKNLKKRMADLSGVFLEMKQLHLNMIKKQLTKEELIAMLMREVMSVCCRDCLDKNRCTRSLGTDNKSSLETLINIAINKGKITLLDIPNSLTNRCVKVNNLVALINRIIDEYKQYKSMLADVNNVKVLLADQMGAVSRLLLDIGAEIDANVQFDIARENKIIARLLNLNIECKEVLIYTEKNEDISAVVIVKNEGENDSQLENVLSETLKVPMQIVNIVPIAESSFCSITLRRKSKFDCIFGLASCNKSGNDECGDCHSIIRLGGNKFLLAICDGMGAGKTAHKTSAMTLGLIENFYKAGFENEIILESVNKLLAVNNQENYSTLDVCLLDLNNNIADFIKVGAPFGIIKRESELEIVEGGALPIGALDSISPVTYKTTITTKDIIIMATDGITDAFETQENLEEFVMHLASTNPQTLAETILNEALRLNEMSAKDDMTVLVARTYLKN
ncbi:MAG: SpoIIE family protein phosphatase, partial [Clostridia bacterium]|nr:SpoIIE family protein phosphatase [Clostridia bacterium]